MQNVKPEKAGEIISVCGGTVVGRIRLQKVAYFLFECGFERDIPFSYRHYGPYSEALAEATRKADLLGIIREVEKKASWGGSYSVFSTKCDAPQGDARSMFAQAAAGSDAVELELAATALFLFREGHEDPWSETALRKPEKADSGRLETAKMLYRQLAEYETPIRLPAIA